MHSSGQLDRHVLDRRCTRPPNSTAMHSTGQLDQDALDRPTRPVELAGRVHLGRVGRSSASRSSWAVECIDGRVHVGRVGRSSASTVELAGRVHSQARFGRVHLPCSRRLSSRRPSVIFGSLIDSLTHSPSPVASAARALIEQLRQPSAAALRAARFARPNGSLRSLVGRFAPSLVLIHSLPFACC